jgi:hypothetical protein
MNPTQASRYAVASLAGIMCLFISDNWSSQRQSSLVAQADARIGRPLTPLSGAGVARRTTRRAVRGAAYGVGAAGIGTAAYYGTRGYGGGYGRGYGGDGYYGAQYGAGDYSAPYANAYYGGPYSRRYYRTGYYGNGGNAYGSSAGRCTCQ